MKRILLAVMFASILVGCSDSKPVAYRPVAFGADNQCYYVHSPAEAQALMDRGLCDRSWAPTVMPMAWHSMYYPYYASPAYYNTYVPQATRTVYVQSERTWGSTNKSAIATATKTATYKGSNGKTVPASKIGAAKYGGGARFGPEGTKFGGGARDASTPKPTAGSPSKTSDGTPAVKPTPAPKPPTAKATPAPKSPSRPSSGSKIGSSGGGSRPSGGYGGGSRGGGSYGGGKR